MKINATMFKNVPGSKKPILDFATIDSENLLEDALDNAMEFFHVSGEIDPRWPIHLIDEDEAIIGVINEVNAEDGTKCRFLLEAIE